MNCSRFESLLTDYMERTLDARVREAAEQHLGSCPLCSRLLTEVGHLKEELVQFPVLRTPAGLADRILETTSGKVKPRAHSLWADLIVPTVSPFLSQRFAFATVIVFVFLSLVVNVLGPGFRGMSASDLSPSNIADQAGRISGQIYKKWGEINDLRNRWIEEVKLLKEDLYGRIDYYLISIVFKSRQQSLREQEKKEPDRKK